MPIGMMFGMVMAGDGEADVREDCVYLIVWLSARVCHDVS